jgi:hypothetical protein
MNEQVAVLDNPAVTPCAYGYMRVPCDVSDDKVRELEGDVVKYAKDSGLNFVCFFFEFSCGSREAFEDLIAELIRTDVHHVVVPSMRHLAQNGLLQDLMLDRLSSSAHAEVLAMRLITVIE